MKINKITDLGISKAEAEELIKITTNFDLDYAKLKEGFPIQYLIGYVNFYGNKIKVNKDVLIPRYETEFLVEKVIKCSKKVFRDEKVNILDLCTGSGAIGIALAKELNSTVNIADISKTALKVANFNVKTNNVDIKIIESDLFNNINDKFDIIVCNPPYIDYDEEIMDSVKKYEPHIALYADDKGLYFYKKILSNIKEHLKEKYVIAFEIGCTQGEEIKSYAMKYFFESQILIEKDLSHRDRYLFIINE